MDSIFGGHSCDSLDVAKVLMNQFFSGGDLNMMLSKSRLRLRVDKFYKNLFQAVQVDYNEIQGFLNEIYTYEDS